jgi:hypothetical protein
MVSRRRTAYRPSRYSNDDMSDPPVWANTRYSNVSNTLLYANPMLP